MAGHIKSGSSDKKPSHGVDDLLTFNAENMQSNMEVIYYSLKGFVFYFLLMAITSLGLVPKSKFTIHSYFDSWNRVLLDGFLGDLMKFLLFWTFAYNIVHMF